MSKISEKEEKRKNKLFDTIGENYYAELKPNLENKNADEMVNYLTNRFNKEMDENINHTLDDISIPADTIILMILSKLIVLSPMMTQVSRSVYENVQNKIRADEEAILVNDDISEIMNNKTEIKEPTKTKGLRV